MWVARTIEQLRRLRAELPGRVAFVPTMGALHAGRLSLVDRARRDAQHVIVSIYVNPTQFGINEDFARYPRPLEQDLKACEAAGVDGAFIPADEDMYPVGQPRCTVDVPQLTGDLEGEQRPGHFQGVCQVVARLLHMVQPDVAVFGRKDYQQLAVIRAMVDDLAIPCRIVGSATMREPDGLAMSSRNVYLPAADRPRAVGLHKALLEAARLVEDDGESDPAVVEAAMQQVMQAHHITTDYAAIRHPHTLAKLDSISPALSGGVIALVAGRLGGVRLLDNRLLAATDDDMA